MLARTLAQRRLVHGGDGVVGRLGPHRRLVQRGLDPLRLAGALGQAQRGKHRAHQREAGGVVALRGARHRHGAVGAFPHGVIYS